jgi:hypothetical protein
MCCSLVPSDVLLFKEIYIRACLLAHLSLFVLSRSFLGIITYYHMISHTFESETETVDVCVCNVFLKKMWGCFLGEMDTESTT